METKVQEFIEFLEIYAMISALVVDDSYVALISRTVAKLLPIYNISGVLL